MIRGNNHYESLLPENGEGLYGLHEAGIIEEKIINDYKKINAAVNIPEIKGVDEEKEPLSTEEINIHRAIKESLKLSRIEKERADNRKIYEKELQRALNLSMQAQ